MNETAAATRGRNRKTSARVKALDWAAGAVIRTGGIGIIAALVLILVFIVREAIPLFLGASASEQRVLEPLAAPDPPLYLDVDEYRRIVVRIGEEPEVAFLDAASGSLVARIGIADLGGQSIASVSPASPAARADLLVGTASGRIARLAIEYEVTYPDAPASPAPARAPRVEDGGIVETTADGLVRRIAPRIRGHAVFEFGGGGSVISAARHDEEGFEALVAAFADGGAALRVTHRKTNIVTEETTETVSDHDLSAIARGRAARVLLSDTGRFAFVARDDGDVSRVLVPADGDGEPREIERFDVVPAVADRLAAFEWLLGQQSILVADTGGSVSTWFLARDANAPDGWRAVRPHAFDPHDSPVTASCTSPRDKGFLTGSRDGRVRVHHMTTERTLLDLEVGNGQAIQAVAIAPKLDGFVAEDASGRIRLFSLKNPHPEVTLGTVFGKVWYEGYEKPEYVWQSTGGTDDFEPKLSLVPLAFGTLKGTFYALLFAVPIALLAAIYTSQFLHPRLRGILKPTVELMASLPSVVLGFIAALILAPLIAQVVPAIVVAFGLGPLLLVAAGAAYDRLPRRLAARLPESAHMALLLVLAAAAIAASLALGGVAERLVFGGDFEGWLRYDGGSGTPLFGIVLFVVILAALWPLVLLVRKKLQARSPIVSRRVAVPATLIETAVVALVLAILLASPLENLLFGGDFRRLFLGEEGLVYDPRNSLVVGFAMGFAVIPIIYAIAEDSITAVPEHLRSGSLACGATRWQTAVRVVLPAALSGIFGAVMVGFGRAVGETMIVLMATGNTAVLDWSVFNGFRALSATVAVELGEAPQGGTLYRVLFLAAVLLFGVTFVVNTLAEIVRLRIRGRGKAL